MATDPLIHVIDDDAAARDSLEFALQAAGFSVRTYELAHEFLNSVSECKRRMHHRGCSHAGIERY